MNDGNYGVDRQQTENVKEQCPAASTVHDHVT